MKRVISLVICIFMLSFLVAGCGDSANGNEPATTAEATAEATEEVTAEAPDEIRIGCILPLSGPNAEFGEGAKNALDLGVKKLNDAGGVKNLGGAKVRVIYGDNRTVSDVSATEAERLVEQEKVHMLTGSYNSNLTVPITTIAENKGIPFISISGSVDMLTERGMKWVFRQSIKSIWARRDQVNLIVDYSKKYNIPIKTVGVLSEDSDWGVSCLEGNIAESEKAGLEVVFSETYPATSPDLLPLVIKLKQANPDVLFLNGFVADGIQLVKGMAQYEYVPKVLYSGGGGTNEVSFLDGVGNLADGIMMACVWSEELGKSNPKTQEFIDDYKAMYKKAPNEASYYTYTTWDVFADVLERTKSLSPEDIRTAIKATDMKLGDGIASYPVQFDEDGQNPLATLIQVQIQNRENKIIYPETLVSPETKIIFPFEPWDKH